jgi:hypothetical protein
MINNEGCAAEEPTGVQEVLFSIQPWHDLQKFTISITKHACDTENECFEPQVDTDLVLGNGRPALQGDIRLT